MKALTKNELLYVSGGVASDKPVVDVVDPDYTAPGKKGPDLLSIVGGVIVAVGIFGLLSGLFKKPAHEAH